MLYEGMLLFAVAFASTWLFYLASGEVAATGWLRHALQLYLGAVFAAYFLWCWLRGGQTLAMKAWRIRLVVPGRRRVPARTALARLAWATLFVGCFWVAVAAAIVQRSALLAFATLGIAGIGLGWAFVDRDRQFLHDRLAGTRLVLVPRKRRERD